MSQIDFLTNHLEKYGRLVGWGKVKWNAFFCSCFQADGVAFQFKTYSQLKKMQHHSIENSITNFDMISCFFAVVSIKLPVEYAKKRPARGPVGWNE